MNRTGKILNSSPAFPFYARKEDIQNALADLNRKNLIVNPSFVPASVTKWRMKREPVIRPSGAMTIVPNLESKGTL